MKDIVSNNKEQILAEAVQRQRIQADQDIWDRIWRDKYGKIVIYQRPNLLLIAWVVLTLISFIFPPRDFISTVLWWLGLAVLAAWSVLEVFKGVNYFRRALGVFVLILIVLMAFNIA